MKPSLIAKFHNAWVIAGLYILAGYSSSPGFLHMWLFIDPKFLPVVPIWTFVVAGLLAALGGVVYSLKVPERFYPKRFDLVGNSHNLFHCMTALAALMAFRGSVRMYHER